MRGLRQRRLYTCPECNTDQYIYRDAIVKHIDANGAECKGSGSSVRFPIPRIADSKEKLLKEPGIVQGVRFDQAFSLAWNVMSCSQNRTYIYLLYMFRHYYDDADFCAQSDTIDYGEPLPSKDF